MWDSYRWWKRGIEETQKGISLILIGLCVSDLLYTLKPLPSMAEIAYPERYTLWLNELQTLGVNTLEKNGLNSHKEVSDLTEAVKQTLYEDYFLSLFSQITHVSINSGLAYL